MQKVWSGNRDVGLPSAILGSGKPGGCKDVYSAVKYQSWDKTRGLEQIPEIEPMPMVVMGQNCKGNNANYKYLDAPAESYYVNDKGELVLNSQLGVNNSNLTPVYPYDATPGESAGLYYKQPYSSLDLKPSSEKELSVWGAIRSANSPFTKMIDLPYGDLRKVYFNYANQSSADKSTGTVDMNDKISSIISPPHMYVDMFGDVFYNADGNTSTPTRSAVDILKRPIHRTTGWPYKAISNIIMRYYRNGKVEEVDLSQSKPFTAIPALYEDDLTKNNDSNGISSLAVGRNMPWQTFLYNCASGQDGYSNPEICKNYTNYLYLNRDIVNQPNDADAFMEWYCFAKDKNGKYKYDPNGKNCACMRALADDRAKNKTTSVCVKKECQQFGQYLLPFDRSQECAQNIQICISGTVIADEHGNVKIGGSVDNINQCIQNTMDSTNTTSVQVNADRAADDDTAADDDKKEKSWFEKYWWVVLLLVILVIIASVGILGAVVHHHRKRSLPK